MSIIETKHQEQKIRNEIKGDLKTTKKSDNIHLAKVISINQNNYPLSYHKKIQQRFFSNAHAVLNLNEFIHQEPPLDHVMFLKNFCS